VREKCVELCSTVASTFTAVVGSIGLRGVRDIVYRVCLAICEGVLRE